MVPPPRAPPREVPVGTRERAKKRRDRSCGVGDAYRTPVRLPTGHRRPREPPRRRARGGNRVVPAVATGKTRRSDDWMRNRVPDLDLDAVDVGRATHRTAVALAGQRRPAPSTLVGVVPPLAVGEQRPEQVRRRHPHDRNRGPRRPLLWGCYRRWGPVARVGSPVVRYRGGSVGRFARERRADAPPRWRRLCARPQPR